MFYDLHTIKDKSSRFYNVNSSDLSEVWCLKENENAILRRTERVMMRAMCGQRIVDKKTGELMNMLGLIVNHFPSSTSTCDWLKVC